MSALPQHRWTVQDYLDFERESDQRHEYYYGEIFAMVGASENHVAIAGSAHFGLYGQLRSRDCMIYQTDMRVRVNPHVYTYPDIVVVCGERRFEDEARTILLNPTLIVEVLSPSTELYDRGKKFHLYQGVTSLQEYVLIAQDTPRVERFLRQDDGEWLYSGVTGLDAALELPSIGCTLALAAVYEKVMFEAEADTQQED